MPEVIQNVKMKNFVESPVSSEFGLTIDQIAEQCKSWGRFNAWLNQDVPRIRQILTIVQENGVSPAFFAAYERTEGYNASWGWLNHTSVNGSPETDAASVAAWVASQSRSTSDGPAWIDFANYNDFVPESVKASGDAHFSTLPLGTIGRVVIAGTAAATWEVYYPNGLKAEYNGVQDYGAPINHMIQYIEEWGGNISGGGSLPGGAQLAVFPANIINISQGEYGAFSHYSGSNQELAIDFVFPTPRWPLSAPFDSEVIGVLDEFAQVNWRSTVPVMGADGTLHDSLVYTIIHDHDYHRWSVGDTIKKGEHIGNSGNAGYSTADHLHLQVMSGTEHPWPTPVSVQLHIYDVFAVNGVDIVNGAGYDWKTSDYQDGTDGGGDPGTDPGTDTGGDIIPLLLSGALNGWYH